jgi:hypothetical protein
MDTAMDADKLAKLEQLLDRQEITDCMARMSRGADRSDREAFLSAFHPDAVIAAGPFVGGPEALHDWADAFQRATYSQTFHKLLNSLFDIDGDTAHVETYYFFVGTVGTETNLLAGGRYIDRFERRDGRWAIALRNNFVEWTSALPAMGSPLGEIVDLHLNGLPARDSSDPCYARPLVNRRERYIPST